MSAYLVVILLMLLGTQGHALELHRELMSASSAAVCQAHADRLADQQRYLHAEAVRRLQGKVAGICLRQGALT